MDIQKLQQQLYEMKNRIGLVGGSVDVEEYDEAEHNVSACISEDWNIKVNVRKGFDPLRDRRQRAYARAKKISDGLETIVLHVGGLHEPAHWELPFDSALLNARGYDTGCPYDVYWHDKILEAVKKALPKDKQAHANYVTNAFEDLMINPRCKEFNGDFSGQVLFWDWEGINRKEEGQEHLTPFYEAFVKLNMHLFGDNKDKALLKRHYSNDEKVDKAVGKVVKELSLPEDIRDTSRLFDKKRWSVMAGAFAKNLAELLEQAPTERLSAYSREDGDSGNGGESGNGIEQKTGTGEGKEEIAFGRYASGDKHSPNFTSYEQLDSLYRRLARGIPVHVEAMTREQSLEIAPLTYRPFDEETDNPAKIKASKLFLTDNGLRFGYPDKPLSVEHRSKIQRKSFPDFKLVVLDNSGSMKQAPDNSNNVGRTSYVPWGDNSKYHFALLGFYGIESFLQQQGIAQYISHGLSLFSSSTRYKESGFLDIEKVRKHALNPDWGSTNLDAGDLKQALRDRESFVLSISDGEIHNWGSEKKEFRELAERNYYAHIQIGGKTTFTRDLETWSLPVFYVKSGEDLSRLMVDTARNTYRGFVRE